MARGGTGDALARENLTDRMDYLFATGERGQYTTAGQMCAVEVDGRLHCHSAGRMEKPSVRRRMEKEKSFVD